MSAAAIETKGGGLRNFLVRAWKGLAHVMGGDNPVLSREVRTLVRLRSVTVGAVLIPVLCTGLVVVVAIDVLFGTNTASLPSSRGPVLLEVGSYAGLFLLGLLGAVMGAQSLAGERQGRTLEPLLLTGMTPWRIVAGKSAAVWTVLAMVVLVCLTPMGICFLLGGVSLPQLLAAVAMLLLASVVPVTFGVCLGSSLRSSRLAVGLAVVAVGIFGPMAFLPVLALAAAVAHRGDPSLLWWADAVLREGPSMRVVVGAVAAPLFAVVAPTWLFLASAVSALTTEGSDGSRPLKWWLLATAPVGAVIISLLGSASDASANASVALYGALGAFLALGALTLAAHPRQRLQRQDTISQLLGDGPSSGARVTVTVTVLSLALAWLVDFGRTDPLINGFAAFVVLGFVVLLAGSGVALSRVLKPRVARLAVLGVGCLVALAPLAVGLAVDVVQGSHAAGEGALFMEISPLGSLARLADAASLSRVPMPPITALVWLLVGALCWGVGALGQRRAQG